MTAGFQTGGRPSMTRMSGLAAAAGGPKGAKLLFYRDLNAVAWHLLMPRTRMFGALLAGALTSSSGWACVLPPDLNPAGADAGPSSPPVMLEVTAPEDPFAFVPPGPITITENSPAMTFRAVDNDPGDVLYVRLYRDYRRPLPDGPETPPLADCQAAPSEVSSDLVRTITCPTNALCTGIADGDNGNHVLEAMISDRRFLLESDPEGEGQDPYRKVADFPRAGKSFMSWVMRCQAR